MVSKATDQCDMLLSLQLCKTTLKISREAFESFTCQWTGGELRRVTRSKLRTLHAGLSFAL